MINRKNFWKLAAVAVATMIGGGVIWAQSGHDFGPFGPNHVARMLQFVADHLDLTLAQQQQAKELFAGARTANEPAVTQLKAVAEQAHAAVKAGKPDAELNQIAGAIGPLVSQIAATHLKAMSTFYATLTQPQKDKLERMHDGMKSRMEAHRSHLGLPEAK